MVFRRHGWIAAAAALALGTWTAGCSPNVCARSPCAAGQLCDPQTGLCYGVDGGFDGGAACLPPCQGQRPVCDTTAGTCKVCTISQGCSGATPTCDPTQAGGLGACVVCTLQGGCVGLTHVCDTSVPGGRCVQCMSDSDCVGVNTLCDTISRVCVSADGGVPNDECSGAEAIPFDDAGVGHFRGDTTNATNSNQPGDQSPTCSASARQFGNDMVYTLSLSAPQDVTVTVTPVADGGLQPVVYLRKPGKCSSGLATDEVSCEAMQQVAPNVTVDRNLAPGTYFLWVDGSNDTNGPTAGPFFGTVAFGPPTTPQPNDDCPGATALSFSGGVATATGNTQGATNSNLPTDQSPSCSPSAITSGADVVYSYALTNSQDVTITVTPIGDGGLQPVVYVRAPGACASGNADNELSCDNPYTRGDTVSTTRLANQPPGTYFVWVDSALNTSGPFQLTVTLDSAITTPFNNDCANADPITLPIVGWVGTTSGAQNNLTDTCAGPLAISAGEVVYTFTTNAVGQFTAKVTPTPVDAGTLFPYLYLRDPNDCAAPRGFGCMVAPNQGLPVTLVAQLDAGTYDLVVDSFRVGWGVSDNQPSGGPFELDATWSPIPSPAANTSCGTANALPLTNDTGVVQATTYGVTATTALSCSGQSAPGLVWQFTTPAAAASYNARAMATSENADVFTPALAIRSNCGDPSSELDCETNGNLPYLQPAIALGLDAGTSYSVWVTGMDAGMQGPFSLEVDVAGVPAPNDACPGAVALNPNTSVAGTTLGAADDFDNANGNTWYAPLDGGTECGREFSGADVVYSYTPGTSGPVTVTVEPQPGLDLGLGVLAGCAQGQCIKTRDFYGDGDPEFLTFDALAGTTYFIVVDSQIPADPNSPKWMPDGRGGFVLGISQ